MLLIMIFIFAAVFLLVYAFSANFFKPRVDIKQRMNRYIDTVTADLTSKLQQTTAPVIADETGHHFREFFQKYGEKLEERGYTKHLELALQKGDIPLRGYEFIFIIIASTVGTALLFSVLKHNLISMLVAGLLGFLAPLIYLRFKQQRKLQRFNNQISDFLVLVSNSLKAGYGFMQAMDMVAKETAPPIQTEFGRALQEINLGMTTEEALLHLAERVNSTDLDLVITAILIQRQIGGNLAEILDNISHTIRERIRIKGEIKTLTAQGRLSGFIIGVLPVAIGLFLLLINPRYITQLFTDPRGRFMIIYAVIAEIFAVLVIRKIIVFKI